LSSCHQPVMVKEVLEDLITDTGGLYVDGTVGTGGHGEAIGRRASSQARLICLDRDEEAIRIASERLAFLGKRVLLVKASYAETDRVLEDLKIEKVQGVLLDLGMSTHQLEGSGRGFSFSRDEVLDMRMDLDDEVTARQMVNSLSPKELERILWTYGEERQARRIAKAIERERTRRPIETSLQLASLVESVVARSRRPGAKHPATRTFQALRIAVNRELENLQVFLDKIPLLLVQGGRLVILSYHSLEDRAVKHAMMDWERGCRCPPDLPECRCGRIPLFKRVHKKGIRPSSEEMEDNPRARSAILRAAERM
jgi:16S rRNA (cytosine1402-N4)-methyltransferase